MINFKARFKNPIFIAQIILAVFTPILAYAGLTMQDITTWGALGGLIVGALSNPYVLGLVVVSVWNAVNDPTTPTPFDSDRALSYTAPGVNEDEFDDEVEDDTDDEFDYAEMGKADEVEEV